MLKAILKHIVDPQRRFFFPGVRYLTKSNVLFAREIALENAMEYVLHSRLEGAYAEFGVWQGRTISAAWHLARERRLTTAFWAFDSFSGLPEVAGRDASGFQHFKQGEFAFGER